MNSGCFLSAIAFVLIAQTACAHSDLATGIDRGEDNPSAMRYDDNDDNEAAQWQAFWQGDNRQNATNYQYYLARSLGVRVNKLPPLPQLLRTARNWQACNEAPFAVPPRELWDNLVPTLAIYDALKAQDIVPKTTVIRSIYRNPTLNACVGGAAKSRHLDNNAVDIWDDSWHDADELMRAQSALCQFWATDGARLNLGLGLYATGAVHLDTGGYRIWGHIKNSVAAACQPEK